MVGVELGNNFYELINPAYNYIENEIRTSFGLPFFQAF